jgi:plastocyanin
MDVRRALLAPTAGALLIATLVACSGGGTAASATPPAEADLTVTVDSGAFEPNEIRVPAGEPFSIFFRNLDPAPHNIAIYTDESASESLFVGDTIQDGATLYQVSALKPGGYFFRCDVHPEMTGTVVTED